MKSKRFPIGTGGGRHPERIEAKREAAHTRNTTWVQLTTVEKIRDLDRRLGVGIGARKQRARLSRKAA